MAEVEAQVSQVVFRVREEWLTWHECNVCCQGVAHQCAGINPFLQGEPEEKPSLRHSPVGEVGKMMLQGCLEIIPARAIKLPKRNQMVLELLGTYPLHSLPLPHAIGVQIGGLLEA